MKIHSIRKRIDAGVARVEAVAEWEDCDREPLELFVETEERHADALAADPNSYVAACLLPAWQFGERRLQIDGELCPMLTERVKTPLGMLRSWFPADFGSTPVLEATGGFRARRPGVGNAVSLLSCGIDSLATLRWNSLHVQRDHPAAIDACLYFAFDDETTPSIDALRSATEPRRAVVEAVTTDAGVEAIPVRTNYWWLSDDGWFYTRKWHGAFLASLVQLFGGRFSTGYVASSHSPAVVQPYGSHPLLDPYFGTAHFRVEHDLFSMDRADKVALVADWPVGVANIRVCQNDTSGSPNCGTCEKCIRTQVHLAGLGKLNAGRASFPAGDLTPELIASIDEYDMIRGHPYYIGWYGAEIPKLRRLGRDDLADALAIVVRSAERG